MLNFIGKEEIYSQSRKNIRLSVYEFDALVIAY